MESIKNVAYPDYLNKEFFKKCLEMGLAKTNIQVHNFHIAIGTNPGDNYTSFMYRVTLNYSEENGNICTKYLMVKSMPTDGDRAFLEDINLFGKERDAYLSLLPEIHLLLDGRQIAPKCYYATTTPIQTIVFEDLKADGYGLDDRVAGLDETRCRLVLIKLAQYHAAALHVLQKIPDFEETFKNGFFSEHSVGTDQFQIFFRKNLKKAAEIVSAWPGFEHFAPKLLTLYEHFPAIALECIDKLPGDIKTVNHGDVWVNNIMFKYDRENSPIDVLFVDFQASYVNSPAFDLNYFFITSAKLDVLQRKEELIEKYYYPAFEQTLKQIGATIIPSLSKLIDEIREHELFSLFNLFGSFPLISLEWEESKSNCFAQFTDEQIASKKRNVGMASQRFLDTIRYALKYYEKLNVFQNAFNQIN